MMCRECAQAILGCSNVEESFLQNIIPEQKNIDMITNTENVLLRDRVRNHFDKELEGIIMPVDMLTMCDTAGISDKGYQSLYTSITARLRSKGFKRSILPTPYSLAMARKSANKTIADMLGGYRWIEDSMPVSSSKNFIYNKFNNVYITISAFPQAMI